MSFQERIARPGLLPLAVFGLLLAGTVGACQEHDLGTACALDRVPLSDSTQEWVVNEETFLTENQILQDGICENFVCLAQDPLLPYCSRPCAKNQPCPEAFTCATVLELGAKSGESYCAYSECARDSDCQDVKNYQCVSFSTNEPEPRDFMRCQRRVE